MAGQLMTMGDNLARWCEGPRRCVQLSRSDRMWHAMLRYMGPHGPVGMELMDADLAHLLGRADELARRMLDAGIPDLARALSAPAAVELWEEVSHG